MGYADVTLTASGDEAIAAVREAAYDIVLMDMMMPGTDGLAATRAIRALADAVHQPMIVALTANALPGDREDCLQAGMDDYMTKPISRDELATLLASAGGHGDADGRGVATDPADARDDSTAAALLATYGPDSFAELVQLFRGTATQSIDGIREGLAERDLAKVRVASHTLKSSAKLLGAEPLSAACERLEHAARAHTWDEITEETVAHVAGLARDATSWLGRLAGL
jgi:CheY-like chemotaxis protein/HPt (histidine-containing phosphotransfer) domain-containing protein